MEWADKCGGLRRLDPSRHEFEKKTRSRCYVVMEEQIPPMTRNTEGKESRAVQTFELVEVR